MAHLKIQPPGQIHLNPQDRKPVIKVIGGDSWHVSTNLYNPAHPIEPATPENTNVEVKLAETQFDVTLWEGGWFTGVYPDNKRAGLCHINIPKDVTENLRRGSYMFSVRVSDILKTAKITEADGSFLVEYKVTSDQHSIPYKDGTSVERATTSSQSNTTTDNSDLKSLVDSLVEENDEIKSRLKEIANTLNNFDNDIATAIENARNAINVANTANVNATTAINSATSAGTAATNAQQAATNAQSTANSAQTVAQNALDTMAKPYPFENKTIINSGGLKSVTLTPFTHSRVDATSQAESYLVSINISAATGKMRDLWLEIVTGPNSGNLGWPENTIGANDDLSNLEVEPNATNIYLIAEYSQGKFLVARHVVSQQLLI